MSNLSVVRLNGVDYNLEDENVRAMIAPTEASSTASAAHAAGTYFILADTLYTATADIAIGDTIAVGTNCAAVPAGISNKLGNEVADLKSAFVSGLIDDTLSGWEKGGFNTTNGANYNSNTIIRNQTKVGYSTGVCRFKLASGYSTLMFAWDLNGNYVGAYKTDGTWTNEASGWKSVTEFDLSTVPNYVIKFAMTRVPASSDIEVSEGTNCVIQYYTDKTLSIENKSADAKAVGNALNSLKSVFDSAVDTELITPINLLNLNDPNYVDGKLSTSTGNPTGTSGKTSGFIPVEEGKTYNWIYGTSLTTSQVISRICAYGSDKAYKSAYTLDSVRGFTVPENSGIAFVRFSGASSHFPPNEINVMFTEGIPDRYYAYFAPYNKYTVKNTALDTDYIRTLGGMEPVYPEWELGSYDNSWIFTDSTTTIMSDYIPVGDHLVISAESGYTAKVYPFALDGKRNAVYPIEFTGEATIDSSTAKFVQIAIAKATPETVTDPNTYGLHCTINRYGKQAMFNVQMSANPNVQDVVPAEVLPQYLALVAVKEKNVLNKTTVTVGYLYRTVTAPFKLYYAQGKPDNIKYLCDWDSSIAGESNNTPIWYCFGMTDEGDIICVHRGEIESSSSPRVRDNPIVYPHTDYAHPVLVELSGTKPTSWISNSGDYAESGHFFFGEYIRNAHAVANVWNVSAPYTSAENWQIIKTYERDIDPSDPSTMVLGKIEHIHHVSRDPFSGVLYVTTGDHYLEARIDYLKDGVWGILAEADEEVCRQLNFVYTPTYVYWASDAFAIYDPETQQMVGGAHKFFRAKRNSSGLIDLDNLERYEIPYLRSSIATYHVAYIKDPECVLILDRQDISSNYTELPFHVWNIKEERLEYANQCKTARGSVDQFIGFRCECCQHYPSLYDSTLSVGFSLYPNSIAVCGNPNPAIIPSQGGNTATDSVNKNQVNTMTLKVVRC